MAVSDRVSAWVPATPKGWRSAVIGEDLRSVGDEALVERCLRGDRQAFGALVVRHQTTITALVARLLDTPEDVEDCVQEALVRAYRSLRSFRSQSKFSTWLGRIGINQALRSGRKQSRRRALASARPPEAVSAPAADEQVVDRVEKKERAKAVREALRRLPERQRLAVTMYYFGGHSYEEIARLLGCAVGTVSSTIFHARAALKNHLAPLMRG